jgi:microcystin-dependent protein
MSITIPTKIPVPFGYAAGVGEITTPIPTASQIGVVNGRASLHDGFPPLTFLPLTAGGVPPFGADFNGILNEITSITQWQQAGGFFPYDSSFSTAIGGYPVGAIIQAANYQGFWLNITNGNTTDPDTGGAGWTSLVFKGLQAITVTTANVTVTQLQSAYPILVISGALTGARSLILPAVVGQWIIQNNTTGAFTLTVKTAAGTGVVATQSQSTYLYGNGTNIYFASSVGVQSFNTRTGTVTLNATDVTTALGYAPYNAANPANYGPPVGTIIQFAGAAAPTGYLACPTTLTNISRTTYAALFAAIGTTWGIGNGSTTFGLPYFPSGYSAVAGVVGTTTPGSVIDHTHTDIGSLQNSWFDSHGPDSNQAWFGTHNTGSTGGAANLGAGSAILFCVKYL